MYLLCTQYRKGPPASAAAAASQGPLSCVNLGILEYKHWQVLVVSCRHQGTLDVLLTRWQQIIYNHTVTAVACDK